MKGLQNFLSNLSSNQCFAFYRNPNSAQIHLLSLSKSSTVTENDDYFIATGFDQEVGIKYAILEEHIVNNEWITQYAKSSDSFDFKEIQPPNDTAEFYYMSMVRSAVNQIKEKKLDKVVLARCAFQFKELVNLFAIFQNILSNPAAFGYILNDPDLGTWAGASPEYLLYKKGNVLSSMALAGTKLISTNQEWAAKEIVEQNVVSDYLHKTFVNNNLQNVRTSKPETMTTGLLQHICSLTFGILTKSSNLEHLIKQMHPTPALGGFPKKEALEFIKEHEGFDRQLYGGYLGRKTHENLTLYVNIRCMRLGRNGIQYFAGAGINAQSDPEKEWLETSNKMLVMQKIIDAL